MKSIITRLMARLGYAPAETSTSTTSHETLSRKLENITQHIAEAPALSKESAARLAMLSQELAAQAEQASAIPLSILRNQQFRATLPLTGPNRPDLHSINALKNGRRRDAMVIDSLRKTLDNAPLHTVDDLNRRRRCDGAVIETLRAAADDVRMRFAACYQPGTPKMATPPQCCKSGGSQEVQAVFAKPGEIACLYCKGPIGAATEPCH